MVVSAVFQGESIRNFSAVYEADQIGSKLKVRNTVAAVCHFSEWASGVRYFAAVKLASKSSRVE